MKASAGARLLVLGTCVAALAATFPALAAPTRVTLWVDDDDDDANGVADRADAVVTSRGVDERLELTGASFELGAGGRLRLFHGEGVVSGASLKRTPKDTKPISLQASAVGEWSFKADGEARTVSALRAYCVAAGKWVAPLFAAVSRERPGAWGEGSDPEAFAVGVRAPKGQLPKQLWLRSYSPKQRELDVRGLEIARVPCPAPEADTECGASEPLRLVASRVDRAHPSAGLALQVELGGQVELDVSEHRAVSNAPTELQVVGPGTPALTARNGEVRLRVHVLRQGRAGSPAIGGTDEGAKRVIQRELRDSAALWSQCGLQFKLEELEIVDPPPTSLLSIGCEQGAVSSGGGLDLNVGSKRVSVRWPAGLDPRRVAERIRAAIERRGFQVELSDNGSTGYTDLPTVDLMVREKATKPGAPRAAGALLSALEEGKQQRPVTDDVTLPICLGEVSLRDGLDHFNDFNAASGTLEERSLIKALQDDDPATIELFVVPSFVNSGRIGESFIYTAGASVRNVLIVDRAGIRAGSRSFVLAHELGHVLLDMPGHPDDFGVDDPGRLMDSDASESSVFGPRRLTLDDCRRVWSQSGSAAPLPLVSEVATGLPKQLWVERVTQ